VAGQPRPERYFGAKERNPVRRKKFATKTFRFVFFSVEDTFDWVCLRGVVYAPAISADVDGAAVHCGSAFKMA
jgi:hypothetical protein